MAISLSPSTSSPLSSTARQRSASPSNATPRSKPFSRTYFPSTSMWVEPQLSLMLTPFGLSFKMVTSAPSFAKIFAAVALALPLAQSAATRIPERSPSTVETMWSMYCSTKVSPLRMTPSSSFHFKSYGRTWSSTISSISISSSSVSLKPSAPKILIPLNSYGLWEAESMMAASASELATR